jgi:RNA polymerase sigma-70 factor (ECF subfamily)
MTDQGIEELYERYRAELQRFFAGQTRHTHAVEDLMQELYKRLLEYHPPAVLRKPQNYLWQVAWNVLNEANATALQHPPSFSDPGTLDQLSAEQVGNLWLELENGTRTLESEEKLDRVLKRLQRTDRAALILHRRDGLSYKAIAERMGVSTHTVKKYIGRALKHFRLHYSRPQPRKPTSDH